nr:hypothetical protein [Fredinandcohnia onubensis]
MNYKDLTQSQKAQLMEIAIKFLMSTVDGFCANEADANKQEYATRLLFHLKAHIDHMLEADKIRDNCRSIEDKISEWKQKLEQASQYDMFLDSDAAKEMLETIEKQQKEIEHLKTVEQAYEAYKSAH